MANTLTFANQTLTDANIFGGISFSHDLNAGDEFTIGNTASASVMFTTDTQLPLYSKDSTNGTFTWTKDSTARGRYYITEVTKQDGMYTVTAYDAMSLLDVSITNLSITYPATASALATLIATYIGCTVQGTINNGTLSVSSLDDDLSIRALLSYIAEASGASVKIDGSDHLCFMYYASSGITLTASDYVKINAADYTCSAIDNVTIFNSEGEIQATYGSGGNSLFIGQNPFLEEATNSIAQTIYNQVSGFAYTPLTVDLFDESGLEVGTKATFGTIQTLVMSLSANENGATATSIGSDTRAEYNKSVVVIANEARAIAIDTQSVASAAAGLLSDMQTAATAAGTTLTAIYATAEAADSVLSGMQAAATAAGTTLNGIYADAEAAKASAETASEYAARALGNLSTVQSVAETLTWITQHGTMTLTTDVALDPTHIYFVVDAGGDYVVGGVTYAIVTEPDVDDIGTYYELTIDESLNNYVGTHLALTSEGLWLLPASTGTNKVLIATGAGSQYTVAGTYMIDSSGNTLASFRADGATMTASNGTTIAHLGYGPGTDSGGGTSDAPYYTLGYRTGTVGNYSVAEGEGSEASGYVSHAEGGICKATGTYSHAEGFNNTASGTASHAEGTLCTASNTYAHAEGAGSTASGSDSHAEGTDTTASGDGSHAEGAFTIASGDYSHAQNAYTKASSDYQTALGAFNIEDNADTYAVIVGNGTSDNARSNALTVDWSGNVVTAGDITVGNGTPPYYKITSSQIDLTESPPQGDAIHDQTVRHNDANGTRMGNIEVYRTSADVLALALNVGRNIGGSWTYNTISMRMDANGDMDYTIQDPSAFRDALHINAYGTLTTLSSALSLTTTAQKVPLTSFTGRGCSLSSNGIKVTNAGLYVVSGSVYVTDGFTALDVVHAYLYRNSTSMFEGQTRIGGTGNYYTTISLGPVIMSLSAGDVVYLYCMNQGGNRGACGSRTGNGIMLWQIG